MFIFDKKQEAAGSHVDYICVFYKSGISIKAI